MAEKCFINYILKNNVLQTLSHTGTEHST